MDSLLEVLSAHKNVETHLIISESAKKNIQLETNWKVEKVEALADHVYDNYDLAAPFRVDPFAPRA